MFLIAIIILRPFIIIQIFKVHDWRFGHLVSGTQLLTNETLEWNKKHNKKKIIIYFFGSHPSVNDYFKSKLISKHFSIQGHWGTLLFILCRHLKFLIATATPYEIDNLALLIEYPTEIVFTQEEVNKGENFLEQFELDLNSKFVCLVIRTRVAINPMSKHQINECRNSEIQTYAKACEALGDLGYTVFRMGIDVPDALVSNHPKVIDYATNGMRTEFLDVFLGAMCTFAISTNTGWSAVPRIFGRPIMFVDSVPFIEHNQLVSSVIIYPKNIREITTGRRPSFNELCDTNVIRVADQRILMEQGFKYEDLSSDELVDAVREMAARVENKFVPTEQQKLMQEKLQHQLTFNPNFQPSPEYYKVRAEYASCFLSKYPNLLD